MKTLLLDFIDIIHTPKGYVLYYSDYGSINHGSILLPINIYNWYKEAENLDTNNYMIKSSKVSKSLDVSVTKIVNKYNNSMKLEFNDNILEVSDIAFSSIKTYTFQTYIDITCTNPSNDFVIFHEYRLLKNYNTRKKAVYFINKFAYRFRDIYKKYSINDDIKVYDVTNMAIELFHGDILYEIEYEFLDRTNVNKVIYKFIVIIIENG